MNIASIIVHTEQLNDFKRGTVIRSAALRILPIAGETLGYQSEACESDWKIGVY